MEEINKLKETLEKDRYSKRFVCCKFQDRQNVIIFEKLLNKIIQLEEEINQIKNNDSLL